MAERENKMSTKERILEEALTLFAERGYNGTGVDLIAERVGIKGPSLYKHFKGKEDILNTLIDRAEERYNETFGSEENLGPIPRSKEEFIRYALGRIEFSMKDPMIRRIRMFLVQEQFRNERLAKITTSHQVDGLQRMYVKIIRGMMEEGFFKKDDPEMLAMETTAPVVIMMAKADRQPGCEGEILAVIERYLCHFCDEYMDCNP